MGFAIIMFIVSGICFGMAIYTISKESKEKKLKEKHIQEKGLSHNSEFSREINHISGLPLTENSKCILHFCDNQIVIESTGQIIKLQKSKILDMNIKNSKEVQNSISGAVGGAILLGPIGAFLGGSTTEFHKFFIIIYKDKNNSEKCISFDIKDDLKAYKEINKYIEDFKQNITERNEIEL